MRQEWEPEELIDVWTLLEDDQAKLRNKSGANRLGFALLLKFFESEARFPGAAAEVPPLAVAYVAQQVGVAAEQFAAYDWSGRAIKRHRTEVRAFFKFHECTEADQEKLAVWLASELCGVEFARERLVEAVVARCRAERMELPALGQIDRLVASAVRSFDGRFCAATAARLSTQTIGLLEELVAEPGVDDEGAVGGGRAFFNELKQDPGAPGLESLLAEVAKLQRVRGLELPDDLFADVSEKLVALWRRGRPRNTPPICWPHRGRCV